jgi:hypothetical protein
MTFASYLFVGYYVPKTDKYAGKMKEQAMMIGGCDGKLF